MINCSSEKGEGSRIVECVFRQFSEMSGFKLQNAAGIRGFLSYTRAAGRCNLHTYTINNFENNVELTNNALHTVLFFSKHDKPTVQNIIFPPQIFKNQHPMLPSKKALERLDKLRKTK